MKNNQKLLWETLKKKELITEDKPPEDISVPWFIRILLGIAGWLGAVFLLLFILLTMEFIVDSFISAIISGVILCVIGIIVFRKKLKNDFLIQFIFAISLVGQGLIHFGIIDIFSSEERLLALSFIAVNTIFFIFFNNFFLKTLTSLMGLYSFLFFLSTLGFYPYIPVILFALVTFVWLYEFRFPIKPIISQSLGSALTILTILAVLINDSKWIGMMFDHYGDFNTLTGGVISIWINAILTGLILLWIGLTLLKNKRILLIITIVLLTAVEIIAPGLTIMISLVVLGFSHGNLILFFTGILSTLGYMSYYYYKMEISLLYKSIFLICFGVVLLIIRFIINKTGALDE